MALLNVGIVVAIHRAQGAFPADAAFKFFASLLPQRFFERIGATAQEEGGEDKESDGECLQALTIMKKVTSDKWRVTSFESGVVANFFSCHTSLVTCHFFPND